MVTTVGRAFDHRPRAGRSLAASVIAGILLLLGATAQAAAYHAPRTPSGAPDLGGEWTNSSLTGLERPKGVKALDLSDARARALEVKTYRMINDPKGDVVGQGTSEWFDKPHWARINGRARTSWLVSPADGQLPLNKAGKALAKRARKQAKKGFDNPEDRPVDERCLSSSGGASGPPMMNAVYSANYKIVQNADVVAIYSEMIHDVRLIRLNARHLPPQIRPWMGDSIGHWEGDTLVVETTQFDPADIDRGQFLLSSDARVVERFRRTAADTILYRFTVTDPKLYKRPWRGEMPLTATTAPIYEYACHEGNYALADALAGARADEVKAARLPVVTAGYKVPHMPTGAPDLQGYWTNFSRTNLERPAGVTGLTLPDDEAKALETKLNDGLLHDKTDELGQAQSEWYPEGTLARIGGKARTSWIVDPPDGKVPYTPEARKLFALWRERMGSNYDEPEYRPPPERCLMGSRGSAGPPMLSSLYQPFYRIVQTANVVAIEAEMNHDVRLIRIGGTHLPAAITPWMGDSIGHWEGDTLVVETTNFNPGEAFRVQLLISPNTRITERFTRVSSTDIVYQFEVEDPTIYTSVWRGEVALRSAPGPLLEYACAEGNYSLGGVLAGAREAERKAKAKSAQAPLIPAKAGITEQKAPADPKRAIG